MMTPVNRAVAEGAIRDSIVDFVVESIEFLGEGDFCAAYCVNHEWVFRVAKDSDASQRLDREALLLPALAPCLNLPVPNIERHGHIPATGLAYVGYRIVPGVELTRERFSQLSAEGRRLVACQLAGFLEGQRSFDLETARRLGVPDHNYPELLATDLQRLRSAAFSLIDSEMQSYCEVIIRQHLQCGNIDFRPSLLHDDLSQWHVLSDSATGAVTGVIDFTDAAIGDPAQDLMYVYDDYGPEFVALLLDCGETEDQSCTLERVHFHHELHTLRRLLWAIENRQEPLVSRRLGELRNLKDQAGSGV